MDKNIKDKIHNKLDGAKIKPAFDYVNKSTKKLRDQMRKSIDKCSMSLYKKGVSANVTSIIGFAIGLLAINFLSLEMYFWALVCILVNRLFDAVDGGIARRSKVTEFGIFLDAALDYIFYTGICYGQSGRERRCSFFLVVWICGLSLCNAGLCHCGL